MHKNDTLTIEAGKAELHYWQDLWRYRELFYFLAWRDFLVRYKQTVIGVAWALVRPLLTMLVFVFVFGELANLPSGGPPYAIMVFSGLLPWQFFSSALSEAGNSLVNNSSMISKVYFPRLIIPCSTIIVCFIDFIVSGIILVGLMAWYKFIPSWHILYLPVFVLQTFFLSLGAGLWISALNVRFRDFRYIIPFVTQVGLYISPVGFSTSIVSDKWRTLFSMNPMVGIIDGFRWTILGSTGGLPLEELITSIIFIILILITGIIHFRRTERSFSDLI